MRFPKPSQSNTLWAEAISLPSSRSSLSLATLITKDDLQGYRHICFHYHIDDTVKRLVHARHWNRFSQKMKLFKEAFLPSTFLGHQAVCFLLLSSCFTLVDWPNDWSRMEHLSYLLVLRVCSGLSNYKHGCNLAFFLDLERQWVSSNYSHLTS